MSNMNTESKKVDAETQVDFILYPGVKHLSEEEIETSGLIKPISQFMKTLLPMHETFEDSASTRNGILLYGAVGCAEDIVVVPILLQFKKSVHLLNLKTLITSKSLTDREVISHIQKFFENVYESETPSLVHIMHVELLWANESLMLSSSIRIGVILTALKCQLEFLARTKTMVLYFTHIAEPWNIPEDFLAYFPTKIWFPPPLSPEARAVAFRYFVRVYTKNFCCVYKVSDEELLEISQHPKAKCLYWNDIRDIVRGALTFVCLAKIDIPLDDIHKIPATGFTKSQIRKILKACVRKVFILEALKTYRLKKSRHEELEKLMDFKRDHSNYQEEMPLGEKHLTSKDTDTVDSPIYSEIKEFLKEKVDKKV